MRKMPPREVFEKFREVIKNNNRALEIIADMGEKLSGDFIFDRRYIESSFADLNQAVYLSIKKLNELNPDYGELYSIYDEITSFLNTIMAGDEDRHGPHILSFETLAPLQWSLVGGKGTHLAEMMQHLEVLVPSGFCITTRTYHDLIEKNGLRPLVNHVELLYADLNKDQELLDVCRQLRQAIFAALPPDDFLSQLETFLETFHHPDTPHRTLAIRSSALEEDLDFSFAGQFHSELNVRPKVHNVFQAYLAVVASLFSPKAIEYRRQLFPDEPRMSIACICQEMIDSVTSGIAYTSDTANPPDNTMVIVAAWGQGASIVEGKIPCDFFHLCKSSYKEKSRQISHKQTAFYMDDIGGLIEKQVPKGLEDRPCLTPEQLQQLAGHAMQLENYFKRPQDIEWCFDRQGRLYVLQSRPLLVPTADSIGKKLRDNLAHYKTLIRDCGLVAQQGIGVGPVKIMQSPQDLEHFPDGAVLVSRRDSSRFAPLMQRASAIITEIGTPVSHMSTLCREFQVPCIVNVPDIISRVEDGMVITVDAEDRYIYEGKVNELLAYQLSTPTRLETTSEFRLLRRLLNNVARLNLVDPLLEEFLPANCRTYHDLLRYVHESAVNNLVNIGRDEKGLLRTNLARHLALPIPAGIIVIDLNGGLRTDISSRNVTYDDILSIPFHAILQGMLFPKIWHRVTMSVGVRDLMNSILSAPNDAVSGQYTGHNVAVISRNYVNLCFRFGYHFNIIDAYCDEVERENHIYFRFLGGATDISKRSRRASLIAEILLAFDFNVKTRSDLVIARSSNMVQSEMIRSLDILGRLVGFTRQLDVRLDSDDIVNRYVEAFLQGNYDILSI